MQYSEDELKTRQQFAKHYTPLAAGEEIARKIMRHVEGRRPLIVDPACGSLNLLLALRAIAPKKIQPRLIGVDISPEVTGKESVKVIEGNAFSDTKDLIGACDVFLTNPPFGRRGHPKLTQRAQEGMDKHLRFLFDRLDLNKFRGLITLECAFIGLGLQLLKKGGIGAIVLPESVFTCTSFQIFRERFQQAFKIIEILELPENTFAAENASVSTGVLIFKNVEPSAKYTYKFTSPNNTTQVVNTGTSYWYPWRNPENLVPPPSLIKLPWKPLSTLMPHLRVRSGFKGKQPSSSHSQRGTSDSAYYVTSKEIKNNLIDLNSAKYVPLSAELTRTIVSRNDVLLVRSGMGCLGRAAVVKESRTPIVPRSEIYTITGFRSDQERELFLISLQIGESESGQPWWATHLGTGVGTPNLNMQEIWSIPILDVSVATARRLLKGQRDVRRRRAA